MLLLAAMLGLDPVGDHLVVDPGLPQLVGHLELLDIPGRWAASTLSAAPGSTRQVRRFTLV